MPSLNGVISQRQILLPIAILGSRNPSDLNFIQCTALLDTGATSSGIGPNAISKLLLRSHQKKPLSVATEMRMVDYYLFRVGFLESDADINRLPYVFAEIDGFSWQENKSFDLILGMDILSQCDLSIKRDGNWMLSFGQS